MTEKYTFIIKAKIIIPFEPLTVTFFSLLQSFLFRVYFRVFSRLVKVRLFLTENAPLTKTYLKTAFKVQTQRGLKNREKMRSAV